ncbi:hypothetical protein MAR_011593 [Mya arenaria]|uniref:Uncharacterized protein n=1 Tax=Mya arenaria TaxID=6604 RepID=A0ABY7FX79_MYAAR|nr:hypothetical protein MAR_011593 [Mya arenaria]
MSYNSLDQAHVDNSLAGLCQLVEIFHKQGQCVLWALSVCWITRWGFEGNGVRFIGNQRLGQSSKAGCTATCVKLTPKFASCIRQLHQDFRRKKDIRILRDHLLKKETTYNYTSSEIQNGLIQICGENTDCSTI